MKVAFHDNCLCVRGTTTALWDYAEWSKKLFNIEPIILHNSTNVNNQDFVVEKFKKVYPVISYTNRLQIDDILRENNCDAFFMIKGGQYDNIISSVCNNWVNAISICNERDIHGDRYAMGSRWLSRITNNKIDYVSYMVNLPNNIEGDLRDSLGIPKDAVVFGRNGGQETFDLQFAKNAIINALNLRKDIYFLFQGTDKFYEHDRIIYLPPSSDIETKVKFIKTSDALIHARDVGESFGLTCAEFSMMNKPVITWFESRERNHIEYLGEKGIYYRNYDELLKILLSFEPNDSIDWKCYTDCLPEPVMEKFKKIYLQ
jgi:hypothetical protein